MRRSRLFALVAAALVLAVAAAIAGTFALRGRQAEATTVPNAVPPAASTAQAGARSGARSATPPSVRLQRLAGSYPGALYLTAPPGDRSRLFVVEQGGRIVVVTGGRALPAPFLDLSGSVSTGGERGLLGLAFDPRFSANGLFYIDYTDAAGDTRVVRYRVSAANANVADPASAHVILAVAQPYPNHNGGQLAFGPDGRLYVGLGDGGSAGDPGNRAQNDGTLLGKIVRISSPQTAPQVSIYAKGLRNPWRFAFDSRTGALWIGDVGQDRWEEVDYLKPGRAPGANLGWSAYEGDHVFKSAVAATLPRASLVWPVAEYSHAQGIAVVGGYVYRGSAIPRLRGWYLFGDYGSARVWAMRGAGGTPQPLSGADRVLPGITSFAQDASGELYVTATSGDVYRIVPGR
jgi:glucose/arabinose dehydrogenase